MSHSISPLNLVRINAKAVMPTVLRAKGYRVVIYPNDHYPAHVHVLKNGRESKILTIKMGGNTWVI